MQRDHMERRRKAETGRAASSARLFLAIRAAGHVVHQPFGNLNGAALAGLEPRIKAAVANGAIGHRRRGEPMLAGKSFDGGYEVICGHASLSGQMSNGSQWTFVLWNVALGTA